MYSSGPKARRIRPLITVDPVVALVDPLVETPAGHGLDRQDLLEDVEAARIARELEPDGARAPYRTGMDPGVTHGRGAHQFVEGNTMGPGTRGKRSSRVARRCPASSRERVLMEMRAPCVPPETSQVSPNRRCTGDLTDKRVAE